MTNETGQLIISGIESIAVVRASLMAVFGINAWRKEMQGKRQFELAEEVLSLFYMARDKIKLIRHPLGYEGEGLSLLKGPQKSISRAEKEALRTFERYNNQIETFNKLYSLQYRFIAHFGSEGAKIFDDLFVTINKLRNAAHSLLLFGSDEPINESDLETIKEARHIIYDRGEKDEISIQIDSLVKQMDDICSKILRKR